MLWKNLRRSQNVEDRRGVPGGGIAIGGGCGTLVLIIVALLFGVNPLELLRQVPQEGGAPPPASAPGERPHDEGADFASAILGDTEDVWTEIFRQNRMQYAKPTLVLFTGNVRSACGYASAAVGPFYCPGDQKVYLDLGFFEELSRRFGAPGDFAQAYVIAHEIGHHIQNQMGTMRKVDALRSRMSEGEANQLSVRLELQADFYAGVWAHHTQKAKQILEPGDVEEALRAATAIGDDRLQRQAQGYVVPDSFTHGTSEQRVRWFRRGFETGDIAQGDTFNAARP
jgi:predicted metalloprotease